MKSVRFNDVPKHYYILSEICVTNVLQGETKKDLHSCKSLIVNAPSPGLEPGTL